MTWALAETPSPSPGFAQQPLAARVVAVERARLMLGALRRLDAALMPLSNAAL